MIFHVSTDKFGSETSRGIGYTKSEWEALTEDEQNSIMNEFLWESVDAWAEEDN